ncbi:MAG: peptidoglycan recognition family protein, partial [Candidatus Promineifilaceae bacterium]
VIAQFHVFSRDWPGIGYHYVVDHSGLIEQVNRLETISYHASGANSYSVGIALKGDFSDFSPGQIQLDAVHWLVTYLRGRLAIQHVLGHREAAGAATECPGDTWGSWKSKVV